MMGVGLVRFLQPPDILWIGEYITSLLTLARGYSFCPLLMPVRSFLYLLYTLIKLYYTKALSDQALSLAPDWILLWGPRIPVSSCDSTTTFQVDSLSLLQRIFPTQGSNWDLLHCRWIIYQLSHMGSPRILERVAYLFLQGIFPT